MPGMTEICVFLAWIAGGFVSGVSGIGGAMVAFPFLVMLLPVHEVIALTCIVNMVMDLCLAGLHFRFCRVSALWPMLLASVPGSFAGLYILQVCSGPVLQGAVGLLMGVTFTGQGLSAGLGGLICDLVGWRVAFICFGALGAAAWLGVRRLRYLDEMDDTSTVDAAGAGVNAAGAGAGGSAEREPFRPAAFLRHAAQILFGPGRAIYFVAFTTGIIFLGVYGFMGTFLAERCGLSSAQAGLLMMFYGLACLAGGSISGRIGEARGQRGVIAVGETSGVIATALLAASTITGSWMPALPAAACLGLGYILVQPTLVSFSMDIDPSHTGLCTGLIGLGVFAGGGIGSSLGGLAIAGGGYFALWTIAGVALVAQAIAGARFLPRK